VEKHANNKNHIFSLRCCITAFEDFNQSMLDFFTLVNSQLMLMLVYDSVNLVNNAVQLRAVETQLSRKKLTMLQQLDCVACIMHCVAERQNCHT